MPVERRPAPEPQKWPDLVDALAAELKNPTENGPRIIEEAVRGMNRVHVTVIWDRWEGVYTEDRSEVILDAYKLAFGDLGMLRVSVALGLTPAEAGRLGVA